ncbi:MAG: hypothetical protein ACI8P3_002931 [Saprospiraceae bacterium]|jgi:hypothetical protein
MKTCFENDYAGLLVWSYNAADDYSDWMNCNEALNNFGTSHQSVVDYIGLCDAVPLEKPLLICNIYPNPANEFIHLATHFRNDLFEMDIEIINAQGSLVKK